MKVYIKRILIALGAILLALILGVAGIAIMLWWPDADKLTGYSFRGDIEGVRLCRRFGVDLNGPSQWGWYNSDGYTPLTAAAQRGQIDVVKYLLMHGAEINRQDGFGDTAIIAACFSGELSLVQFLYKEGADPAIIGNDGTSLHQASSLGHISIMAFLLDVGLPVNILDNSGAPPLRAASVAGNVKAVRYLLEKGAGRTLDTNSKKRILKELQSILGNRKQDYDRYAEKNGWADEYDESVAHYEMIVQYLTQDKSKRN